MVDMPLNQTKLKQNKRKRQRSGLCSVVFFVGDCNIVVNEFHLQSRYYFRKGMNSFIIFTNPSARAGYDTRSIFKRGLTGLNSEFSFF